MVRQRVLVPPFGGSNPSIPAKMKIRVNMLVFFSLVKEHKKRLTSSYGESLFIVLNEALLR